MNFMKRLRKRKKGSGLILVMIMVFFLVTFIVTVGEFYRIHIMQQDIDMHLQRTVNCAVEYAMGDTYRQDKIGYREGSGFYHTCRASLFHSAEKSGREGR